MESIDWTVAAIHAACYVAYLVASIGLAWWLQRVDQRKAGG